MPRLGRFGWPTAKGVKHRDSVIKVTNALQSYGAAFDDPGRMSPAH